MNARRCAWLFVLCAVGGVGGCATITRGTTEVLVINTEPTGASVQVTGGYNCTTPCSLDLKRKRDYHVKIEKPGYKTVETDVMAQVVAAGAAGMAGNVVLGGLIGAGVDLATGAMKGFKPNPLDVKLEPAQPMGMQVLQSAAAATNALASVAVEQMCIQTSKVDRAECQGRIKLGMSQHEVLAALGMPDAKSADERTLRYTDRYLEFDHTGRLVGIRDVASP